ncbi:GIY-YIG nuclease family protein [bacterium]|jgi:excinuclease UvrABC nuclease subunit|nr:GIY-YIG nuclease family protein [bacterium]
MLQFRDVLLEGYSNPLSRHFGESFFSALPKTAGVYYMLDQKGDVLYVGKAKCLRDRVRSYKNAGPESASIKVLRMLFFVRKIQWERCESEKAALIRENELLRTLKPPFNVLNTQPESYCFIGLRFIELKDSTEARFRLTTRSTRKGDLLFGAFKGRAAVRDGYAGLLRLLWAAHNEKQRFEFPAKILKYRPPALYSLKVEKEIQKSLPDFLSGKSETLLQILSEKLLTNESIPPFFYHAIQEDLQSAREFWKVGPQRNQELKKNHGIRTRIIPQERLDDLIVYEKVRLGQVLA